MAEPVLTPPDRTVQRRIAVISMHASPTASLGTSANGGLNVYVRAVGAAFSDRGIATDIFTRRQTPDDPEIERLAPLSRVIYIPAGNGLDKYALYAQVPSFAAQIFDFATREQISYDLMFSHYWLSGEVACLLRPQLAPGWAHVAHTLGLVKDRSLPAGAAPEPPLRIRVEGEIAQQSDLLIASTAVEARELVELYHANPERIAVVAPGVDLALFRPISRAQARRKIGYAGGQLILFVGRLERLKGVAVAIHALAELRDRHQDDVRLMVLGEDADKTPMPTDGRSEKERLKAIARMLGVQDRVDFAGSVAHHELPYFYGAADVLVMPSYSESFGLVALEAQACGRPVVGSGTTGLRSVVRDGVSGYLIDERDPAIYADRIERLLANPQLAERFGRQGRRLSRRFSWTRTADQLQDLFDKTSAATSSATRLRSSSPQSPSGRCWGDDRPLHSVPGLPLGTVLEGGPKLMKERLSNAG